MSELLFLFSLKKKKSTFTSHILCCLVHFQQLMVRSGQPGEVPVCHRNNCFGSPRRRRLHFIPDVLESDSSLYSKGDKSEGNSNADNGGFVVMYFLKMFYQGVKQADNMLVLICQMLKLRAPVRLGFRLNFSDQRGTRNTLSSFYLFGLLPELSKNLLQT